MADALVIPAVSTDDDGWEHYATAIGVERDAEPGFGTPEASVVHFYAALMRGDRASAEGALENPDSERTQAKMATLASWTVESVSLLARKMRSPHKGYVRLALSLTVDGKKETGEDDVTVRLRDGRWLIQRPPT